MRTEAKAVACPACESPNTRESFVYPRLPVFYFPMPAEAAKSVFRRDLHLSSCSICGHIFQTDVDPQVVDRIYRDFYAHYPFDADAAFLAPYRTPFEQTFDHLVSSGARKQRPSLLEIGCSEPAHLRPFVERGFYAVGVDPSPRARSTKIDDSTEVVSGFYESTDLGRSFNVIVSRFSLEHVIDANLHVAKMASDLAPEGVVIVQVPNIERYLRTFHPFFAAHEHIHYFTLSSLCSLFARHGMAPVSLHYWQQPSIIVGFSKGAAHTFTSRPGDHDLVLGRYRNRIKSLEVSAGELLAREPDLLIYGWGMGLTWLLNACPGVDLGGATIVDDNPKMWGKTIPPFDVRVQAPTQEIFRRHRSVLLAMNSIYHDRVLRLHEQALQSLRIYRLVEEGVRSSTACAA